MKIGFEKFAKAGVGTIDINDLTVICGPNNTGKTYINYAIFSILENMGDYFDIGLKDELFQEKIKQLLSTGNAEIVLDGLTENFGECINNIEQKIKKNFHRFFNVPAENFANIKLTLDIDELNFRDSKLFKTNVFGRLIGKFTNGENKKFTMAIENYDEISKSNEFAHVDLNESVELIKKFLHVVLFNTIFSSLPVPFSVSSERTGISLFYKTFDQKRDEIIEAANNGDDGNISYQKYNDISHAQAIVSNIRNIRSYEDLAKNESFITRDPEKYEKILALLSELLEHGSFNSSNGVLYFHPDSNSTLPEPPTSLRASSSLVKSLFLIDLFVRHVAKDNHILIIDEPELNLYLANQAKMARLLARLVNCGIKVLVTTHSDFLLRELNNLIALSSIEDGNDKSELMQKFSYDETDILNRNQVSAYITTENQVVEKIEVNEFGINTKTLDKLILDENAKTREVFVLVKENQ